MGGGPEQQSQKPEQQPNQSMKIESSPDVEKKEEKMTLKKWLDKLMGDDESRPKKEKKQKAGKDDQKQEGGLFAWLRGDDQEIDFEQFQEKLVQEAQDIAKQVQENLDEVKNYKIDTQTEEIKLTIEAEGAPPREISLEEAATEMLIAASQTNIVEQQNNFTNAYAKIIEVAQQQSPSRAQEIIAQSTTALRGVVKAEQKIIPQSSIVSDARNVVESVAKSLPENKPELKLKVVTEYAKAEPVDYASDPVKEIRQVELDVSIEKVIENHQLPANQMSQLVEVRTVVQDNPSSAIESVEAVIDSVNPRLIPELAPIVQKVAEIVMPVVPPDVYKNVQDRFDILRSKHFDAVKGGVGGGGAAAKSSSLSTNVEIKTIDVGKYTNPQLTDLVTEFNQYAPLAEDIGKQLFQEKITELKREILKNKVDLTGEGGELLSDFAEAEKQVNARFVREQVQHPQEALFHQLSQEVTVQESILNRIKTDVSSTQPNGLLPQEVQSLFSQTRVAFVNHDVELIDDLIAKVDQISQLDQSQKAEMKQVLSVAKAWAEIQKIKLQIDRRVEEIGITDPEMTKVFAQLRDPEEFVENLKQLVFQSNGDQSLIESFIKKFREDVTELSSRILSVTNADQNDYFEKQFQPLLHEIIYQNIVEGLNRLTNLIKSDADLKNINLDYELFSRARLETYTTQISLSGVIDKLKSLMINYKDTSRYSHNVSVLIQKGETLETMEGYAKGVSGKAIDELFEENPELEVVIRLFMNRLRNKCAIDSWLATPEDILFGVQKGDTKSALDLGVLNDLSEEFPKMESWKQEWLLSMARGYVLGVSGEALDTLKHLFLGSVNFRGHYTVLREMSPLLNTWLSLTFDDIPRDLLFVPVSGKDTGWQVSEAIRKSKLWQTYLDKKGIPMYTTEQLEEEGIPFVLEHYQMGMLEEWLGWRKKEIFKEILSTNADGTLRSVPLNYDHLSSDDREWIIRRLLNAKLSAANRFIDDFIGDGISRDERMKLRGLVLGRLADVAPQEVMNFDSDFRELSEVKNWFAQNGGDYFELVNSLGRVTNYLLDRTTALTALRIQDLTDAQWAEIFSDPTKRNQMKSFALMLNHASTELVYRGGNIDLGSKKYIDYNGKEIVKKRVAALVEAKAFRSMSTYFDSKRSYNHSNAGPQSVARMIGDTRSASKALMEFQPHFAEQIKKYFLDWDGAKSSRFADLAHAIGEVGKAFNSAFGPYDANAARASKERINFSLGTLAVNLFKPNIASRVFPLGLGALFENVVSFAHKQGAPRHVNMGAGEIRTFGETMAALKMLTPIQGGMKDKIHQVFRTPRILFIPPISFNTYHHDQHDYGVLNFYKKHGATLPVLILREAPNFLIYATLIYIFLAFQQSSKDDES